MRSARGQGTVEYIGLILMVSLAFGVLGVVAWRTGIGEAVVGGMHRAICVVTGGDCSSRARPRAAPCVVATDGKGEHAGIGVAVLRLSGGVLVLVERRSDGSYAVTRAHHNDSGIEAALPTRFGEVRAALLARLGRGKTWIVGSRDAVDSIIDRFGDGSEKLVRVLEPDGSWGYRLRGSLPPPDEVYDEGGVTVGLGATVKRGPVRGALDLRGQDVHGTRLRKDGSRVLYLRPSRRYSAAIKALGRDLTAGREEGDETFSVELDRRGRPVALTILQAGELRGQADLPSVIAPAAGHLAARGKGAHAYEVQRRLDLRDPASLAVARAFLAEVRSPSGLPGGAVRTTRALEARIASHGTTDARTYAVDAGSDELGLAVGKGLRRLEATYGSDRRSSRLLAAITRGPDGRWTTRDDCLGAAGVRA